MSASAAARFLDQATWGPTPASIAELEQMGIGNWLNAQFALNTVGSAGSADSASAGKSNNNLTPVQAAFFQNAVTGQDQLRQRVAFILEPDLGGFAGIRCIPAYALSSLLAHFSRQRFRKLPEI